MTDTHGNTSCEQGTKVFNDPIHGVIELPSLCVKIINTPQFQRLRFIKQLGGSYFVYPGAAHNRFEHSIGVCHLAGKLVEEISRRQADLEINPRDVLCVQIAGLCHDIGHGPFSHVFDRMVIAELKPDRKWKHEQGSVDMIDHMFRENKLRQELKEKDIDFIKELILGPKEAKDYSDWLKTTVYGKTKKMFLYEVINNKRNEIDVDKWDYFARDCHMLGIGNNFDHNRSIALARVIEIGGEWQICYRDKEYTNLLEMFHTRYQLYRRAYHHKTVNGIEMMISKALVKADSYIFFLGQDRSPKKMSEAMDDMSAFSLMTDEVFYRILNDPRDELENSRNLLLRILKRDIYQQVAEKPFDDDGEVTKEKVKEELRKEMKLKPDDEESFEIHVVSLNYGRGNENPMNYVNFYRKESPNTASRITEEEVSLLLPRKWAEKKVRIYSKYENSRELVSKAAERVLKSISRTPAHKRQAPSDHSTSNAPVKKGKKIKELGN